MTAYGFSWSQLAASMDAGDPCPPPPGTTPLALQSLHDTPTSGPLSAMPGLDLDEDPPVPPPARAYINPPRRGWLRRAIEGIFG